jgi:hypothetical protein
VQEITAASSTAFGVKARNEATGQYEPIGLFQTEPYPFGAVPHATAENVQKALEAPSAYGEGNVVVTGQGPEGTPPLKVTSVGKDADRPVPPLEVVAIVGTAQAKVLAKGQADGVIAVTALNLGDGTAQAVSSPVNVLAKLPPHLRAVFVEGNSRNAGRTFRGPLECVLKSAQEAGCTYAGTYQAKNEKTKEFETVAKTLPPYAQVEALIGVIVEPGASSREIGEASVSGGGAPAASAKHPISVSGSPTPFGVEAYEQTAEEVGGAPDAQAGSHPFQLTTTLNLNQTAESQPVALAKDLHFRLPPGLIGNPTAYPHCSIAQFYSETSECPPDTVVGVADVTVVLGGELNTEISSIYNLEPAVGEPGRFGFRSPVPVILDTSVRTGEDYGVTVHVSNITQAVGFTSNSVTFWGVPGDVRHDSVRGGRCLAEAYAQTVPDHEETQGKCHPLEQTSPVPFLTLPTSCTGPLSDIVEGDSWVAPQTKVSATSEPRQLPQEGLMQAMNGCGTLLFSAGIKASPDVEAGSSPSGLKVDVHVPQEEALNPQGLAPADLKNITVTLPSGLQLNPSAADGLQACTQGEVGLSNSNEASCPNASKIANVTITTPLLPNPLKGFVYLASPQNFAGIPENPFSSLVAMYLVAKDPISGTLVKLAGSVSLNPANGQITSTFANNPQLPFEDAEIQFFGGERAPLATPARCGSYETTAVFEPWTNGGEVHEVLHSSSQFNITSGPRTPAAPGGSPCPGTTLPFSPALASESTDVNAGGFTPLSTTLSREDGQQSIGSVQLHYPPGLSGLLSGVKLCPEAQANAGMCGPESLIGETIVSVGLGGDPFSVTGGKVYLTERYAGAPFGLSIVNPAQAGPFILQEGHPVVVRAKIEVDLHTAALTITTDPPGSPHAIPPIIEGIPLQIKHVNVTITRPGFTFNPTNCNHMQITGSVNSTEGATAPVSVPFQVTNCAVLGFAPKFKVLTSGHTSKAKGASLSVKLAYPNAPFGSQANIKSVKVDLPKQLPSRLTTLQKACTAAQFAANPAGCPPASVVGHAKVITSLLPVPLEGPAYFVSNGGEAFPNLIIVLQGYGVTVDLVGDTFISKQGITSSTFKATPDVPFDTFELSLPEGRFSALAANANLCATARSVTTRKRVTRRVHGHTVHILTKTIHQPSVLRMPTRIVAQNGAVIKQSTQIAVTGCAKHKAKRAKKAGRRRRQSGQKHIH